MDELIPFKFDMGKNIYFKRLNYEIQILLTNKKMIAIAQVQENIKDHWQGCLLTNIVIVLDSLKIT